MYVAVFVEVCVADLTDNRALHLRRSVTSHLESYTCVPNSILYITNSIILHTNIFIREPCISQIRHVSPRVICVSQTRILHLTNSIICATNYYPVKHFSKFATPHLLSYVCHEFVSYRTLIIWSVYLCRSTTRLIYCHMRLTNSYHMCHDILSICRCVSADPLRLTFCHMCVTDSYYVCHEL